MKPFRFPFFLLMAFYASGGAVHAAYVATGEATPELRGVAADFSGKYFGLFIPQNGQTAWATVGRTVGGWTLKKYNADDDTLVVVKDGHEVLLHLNQSVIAAYNSGSRADGQALLKAMKFRERASQGISQSLEEMLKGLLASNGLVNPTPVQLEALQKKVAQIFDPAEFEAKVASAMGVVYTEEELKAQTDFYASAAMQAKTNVDDRSVKAATLAFDATPIGQSIKAKQSLMDAEMQTAVQPWLNGVMTAVQAEAVIFANEQGTGASTGSLLR